MRGQALTDSSEAVFVKVHCRDIYSGHLSKLKNREEFEGVLHKKGRKKGGKEEKKKRVIKHT